MPVDGLECRRPFVDGQVAPQGPLVACRMIGRQVVARVEGQRALTG